MTCGMPPDRSGDLSFRMPDPSKADPLRRLIRSRHPVASRGTGSRLLLTREHIVAGTETTAIRLLNFLRRTSKWPRPLATQTIPATVNEAP